VDTPASGPAITWAYSYDWLDRLIRVDKDTVQQSVYVYDESDNRLELQLPGETHHYTFDFADRLLARSVNSTPTETFSHDADGNMIARTAGGVTTNYSWDSFDKLTSIQKPGFQQSFRYDSEGIRKSKGSDTRYFSSGATSLVDLLPTNSISYIQGHLILGMLQGGNYYWYIPDGLGTVRLVMDSSGTTVVSSFASDEFGRQTAVTGSPTHTFTGALGVRNEVGIDSQLLYARQRWYDPTIGRFLNQDPIGFAGGLNLFTYVDNNPIHFVDPDGLAPRGSGPFTFVIPLPQSLIDQIDMNQIHQVEQEYGFKYKFTAKDPGFNAFVPELNTLYLKTDLNPTSAPQSGYLGYSDPKGILTINLARLRAKAKRNLSDAQQQGCPDEDAAFRQLLTYTIKHETLAHLSGFATKRLTTYKTDDYEAKGYIDSGENADVFNPNIVKLRPEHTFWRDRGR